MDDPSPALFAGWVRDFLGEDPYVAIPCREPVVIRSPSHPACRGSPADGRDRSTAMAEVGWQEQRSRVLRWLIRIRDTAAGRVHDSPTDSYEDEVIAFFQACYHLKDWLKNDPASRVTSSEVEDFVERTPSLRLCGDLANGSKHLQLDRPRVDPDARIGARNYKLGLGGRGPTISVTYTVEAAGKTYDALTLAEECWGAWETYLLRKGLISARTVLLDVRVPTEQN